MPPTGPIRNQRREAFEEARRTRFFWKRTQDRARSVLSCGMYQLIAYTDGCMWLNYFGEGRQLTEDERVLIRAAIDLADNDPQVAREQLTPVFDKVMFGD